MIKKTLKNVRRLKWFSLAAWLTAGAAIMVVGWMASLDRIETIPGIILAIVLPTVWGFWFEGWMVYTEIEEEMEAQANGKTDWE